METETFCYGSLITEKKDYGHIPIPRGTTVHHNQKIWTVKEYIVSEPRKVFPNWNEQFLKDAESHGIRLNNIKI